MEVATERKTCDICDGGVMETRNIGDFNLCAGCVVMVHTDSYSRDITPEQVVAGRWPKHKVNLGDDLFEMAIACADEPDNDTQDVVPFGHLPCWARRFFEIGGDDIDAVIDLTHYKIRKLDR